MSSFHFYSTQVYLSVRWKFSKSELFKALFLFCIYCLWPSPIISFVWVWWVVSWLTGINLVNSRMIGDNRDFIRLDNMCPGTLRHVIMKLWFGFRRFFFLYRFVEFIPRLLKNTLKYTKVSTIWICAREIFLAEKFAWQKRE